MAGHGHWTALITFTTNVVIAAAVVTEAVEVDAGVDAPYLLTSCHTSPAHL